MNFKSKKSHSLSIVLDYYFSQYKTWLIGFCGLFLLGIVIGVFSYIKFSKVLDLSVISKGININLLVNKVGVFSFAFNCFFKHILNIGIIILLCLSVFTSPFSFAYIAYCGYVFGASGTVIVIALGGGGIFGLILFFAPISLAIYFLIINIACICEKNCFSAHRFGKLYKSNCEFGYNLKTFLLIICFILALCFLLGILLPQSIRNLLMNI